MSISALLDALPQLDSRISFFPILILVCAILLLFTKWCRKIRILIICSGMILAFTLMHTSQKRMITSTEQKPLDLEDYFRDTLLATENQTAFHHDPDRIYFQYPSIGASVRRDELINLPILGSVLYTFHYSYFHKIVMGNYRGFVLGNVVRSAHGTVSVFEDIAIHQGETDERLYTHEFYHAGFYRLLARYGVDMIALTLMDSTAPLISFRNRKYSLLQVDEYFAEYGVGLKYDFHFARRGLYTFAYSPLAQYALINHVFMDFCWRDMDCYLDQGEEIMSLLLAELPMKK